MIVQFHNYTFGNKIASLALDSETYTNLVQKGLNTIFLSKGHLYFYPENQWIQLGERQSQQLENSDNYDVFQISESGRAFKYYDNESSDNGFMLTAQCNSNCIMCPASDLMRRNELTPGVDEILEIIRHMPSDAKHITITGGEPFLLGPRIFEIFHAFKEKCPDTKFQLLTNGRALSYEPFMHLFHENAPNKILIGIPLHGYDSASHDGITRSPGGFYQTVEGIKNLINFGYKVELRMVVSRLNAENITKIAELIVREFPRVHRVEIMGLEMLGNAAKNQAQVWLPYHEAFKASKGAVDILTENSIQVGLYNFPLCSIDPEYHMIAAKSISGYKIRFAEACEACAVKDACGGIFAGTIRLAQKDVKPL